MALSEGAGGTIGWLTTNERKESMCLQMREALRIGNVAFHEQFFTNTMSTVEMRKVIGDEMRNFSILVEAPKTPFGKGAPTPATYTTPTRGTHHELESRCPGSFVPLAVKKTYSGKTGGRNDDVVITFQLALAGVRMFYSSSRYASFRPTL